MKAITESAQLQAEEEKENVKAKANVNANAPITKFLSCTNLYTMMKTGEEKILLIDCRPFIDFEGSRIKYKNLINIPGDLIRPG